jgi:hypothetical protein
MKALTVRVPDELDVKFSEFCQKRGYKKGGFILSLLTRILDADPKALSNDSGSQNTRTVYRPTDARDPLSGIEKLLGKGF